MISSDFWLKKKVFITGHTGFVGTWLCNLLINLGADVTGYALPPHTNPSLFEICGNHISKNITSIVGDIRDSQSLFAAFKEANPEIVIHMAAQSLVLDSYNRPGYTYAVNVMGTVNILECIRQSGHNVKSVLNVTTDKVYLNNCMIEGYKEEHPLCGFDPYSNSKSCSELVTYSYRKAFLETLSIPVSTARSGNIIGGGDFSNNRLIPDCATATSVGKTIILRNPDSIRPYQHIFDTLNAYLLIAQSQYQNPTVADNYNIGPEREGCSTNRQLVELFCRCWGNGARYECIPAANPHEDAILTLNCSKIRQKLNWYPLYDINRAICDAVEWYRSFFSGDEMNSVILCHINNFLDRLT